ncbi:KRAB-A domain-containing 2-like isoform X1 [Brachionus plicatilis]|uniref:KRAB-A domain-containing 2-like isoform X1 n=1 Tax=Brachionus plicatilis TaxID=10195 RepID=A0A3M7QF81_BRAPC|nr:KRAB-A domain-containing 2-like isoform X1 [Brachionus plicatilis]
MFHICKQKLLNIESLDLSCEKTLREINSLHSICGGQGILKCNCSGKCERNSSCKKSNVLCNSKCHKGQLNSNCTSLKISCNIGI